MPQYAVPAVDAGSAGDWFASTGFPGDPLYPMVAEIVANDSTYASGSWNQGEPIVRWQLAAVVDPQVSNGYVVRWRTWQQAGGAPTVTQTVRLYQGTTIIWLQQVTLTASVTEHSFTLAGPEADAITNHANLYLDFEHDQHDSGPQIFISLARLEVPLAGFTHLDLSGAGFVNAPQQSGAFLLVSGAGFQRVAGTESTGALTLDVGCGLKVN